jgi:hypothetical protein
MQKGNQKAVDIQCEKVIRRRTVFWLHVCIVCPPSSDYRFALSVHRLLITCLHCLSTVFWLPFCIVCPPPSDYLFVFSVHRLLITFKNCAIRTPRARVLWKLMFPPPPLTLILILWKRRDVVYKSDIFNFIVFFLPVVALFVLIVNCSFVITIDDKILHRKLNIATRTRSKLGVNSCAIETDVPPPLVTPIMILWKRQEHPMIWNSYWTPLSTD